MRSHFHAQSSRRVIALLFGCCLMAGPIQAQGPRPELVDIVSPNPPSEFSSPEDAMAAFKAAVSASDLDRLATLLGVNGDRLKATEGVEDTLALIKEGVSRRIGLETQDDQSIIDVGFIMWPFPFPIVKKENGKFAFDPVTGIEEIINRRVGENEIQAIETLRGYVDAQEDYALDDHDGDGVLEYAQKLVSTEGQADGLYWPLSEGLGPSPAGPLIDFEQYNERQEKGYFGYRYKVISRQGDNIAGGAFDYVINGNMIAGFALVAWPVKYGETGVNTFVVNRNGIVYQADLGADTEKIAPDIRQFNPSGKWMVTED
jgi:hypothetical protein